MPVYATAIDGTGRLVADLEQTDFEVLDNGKPVTITSFSNDPQPFTAVVMLDTSASMTEHLKLLNQAAEQFLMRLLPVDRAQVGAFNDKLQLSGTFSNDRDELIAALDDLQFGNSTRLWDGLAFSLDALKGVDGRSVVLLFTDGDDTGSKVRFGDVQARARDEEVMVYAIGLSVNYFNGVRQVPLAARPQRCAGSPRRPAADRSSCRRATSSPRPSRAWRRSCAASTCWRSSPRPSTARCTSSTCG